MEGLLREKQRQSSGKLFEDCVCDLVVWGGGGGGGGEREYI